MSHAKPTLVRFSLRTLLLLTMLLCIVLATIVSGSPRVALAMYWASVLAPVVGVLFAAGTRGTTRAFWIGFAALGLWAYVQLFMESETQRKLKTTVSQAFHDRLKHPLLELHDHRFASDAMALLRKHRTQMFEQDPAITPGEIQVRFPKEYRFSISAAKVHATEASFTTAWHHLHLAIAMIGGCAVAVLNAWSNRRHTENELAAGMNPAAR